MRRPAAGGRCGNRHSPSKHTIITIVILSSSIHQQTTPSFDGTESFPRRQSCHPSSMSASFFVVEVFFVSPLSGGVGVGGGVFFFLLECLP
eukprot:m.458022 g.458022  ORF g.458022 m.458022 type:complete len:91 (-) comp56984_c0_seq3:126-398(-)